MRRAFLLSVFCFIGVSVASAETPELGASVNKSVATVTGVTFRVWAPNAKAVAVAGDFNNWSTTSLPLAKEPGSPWNGIWTATVAAARPGDAYKYFITPSLGAAVWKKDPRARQVRTQSDGTQASVIYDKDAFDWENDNFEPPWPNDIVMYEMHVGTFYDPTPQDGQPATFDDAILKLDYLKALGVNMIALMPVAEFSGRHSWGYNPTDIFAIEETYGGPDALKRFVKAAHKRGIAVQVDVVHNHYDVTSDLVNFDGTANPYFYASGAIASTQWGPRPRYSDPNVQQFIADQIRMLLDEYKIWALRWDSPRNITAYDSNGDGEPDVPIADGVTMMQQINAAITARDLRYYSIAEDADVPGGYSGHWEISFHDVIFPRLLGSPLREPFLTRYKTIPWLNDRSKTNIGYRLENKQQPGFRVVFSENHDKAGDHNTLTDGERLASDLDPTNAESWSARKKSMLAAALTLTSAGTPMLFMGQEQLANGPFKDTVAVDWKRAGRFPEVVRFHRDMMRLRRNMDDKTQALTYTSLPTVDDLTGVTKVSYADETNGVLVYERTTGATSASILVAVNFSESDKSIGFGFPSAGPWICYLNSDQKLYGADFRAIGPAHGSAISTDTTGNRGSLTVPALSVVVLGKSTPAAIAADANTNGIDDGWEILFGAQDAAADPDADGFSNAAEFANGTDPTVPDRARLAGTFNDWNIVTDTMRWDPARSVWRHVVRFTTPGIQSCKAYLASGWVAGGDHVLTVSQPGTYEITYKPSDGTYATQRIDADANANGMADAWEAFYFYPATSTAPSADPDGDGLTNLQEFTRGSDPTVRDYATMRVVGAFSGWNWSANPMRYTGHGIWTFAIPFRTAPADRSFKIGTGPASTNDNWGDTGSDGTADYFSSTDMQWTAGATGWQLVRFNEKNLKYSVTAIGGGADTDGDGMPDAWEQFYGLDPFANDAAGDSDGDGVRNVFEFARLTSPLDASDHYAVMHMPGNGLWDENDSRTAMKWNPANARWEYVFFAPRATTRDFKFMAGTYETATWGWNGAGTAGIAVKWANGNISANIPARGQYLARFEEAAGTYELLQMPAGDTDGDGMPNEWERFYGFDPAVAADSLYDTDGDGVSNLGEYRRGGAPRVADHFSSMKFVGTLNGWSFTATPLRWNSGSYQWELLQRVTNTATGQEGKFSAGTTWNDPDWGDNEPDGIGDRDNGTDIKYSIGTAPSYLHFRFDEITLDYVAGPMSAADTDADGLADVWAAYHGVSGANGNPDNDPFTNAQELVRGTDPNVADSYNQNYAKMRVVGSFTGWAPATSPLMSLAGDNLWQIDLTITNSVGQAFKFVAGETWSDPNWGSGGSDITLPNSGAGTYRFTFNDATKSSTVARLANSFAERYPQTAANDKIRGLPALAEYLFGGTLAQPPPQEHLPAQSYTNSKLRFTFVTRTDDNALTHRVVTSTNLTTGSWTTNGVTALAAEVLSGTNLTRRTYEVPADAPQRFLRIVAEQK